MKMLFCGNSRARRSASVLDDAKRGRKEVFAELGQEPLLERANLFLRAGQGKDRAAAAAHERVEDFGLFAEPVFHSRQPRIFLKGGWFQVVSQCAVGEDAARLAGSRVLRVGLVGPRRRDAEAGMDEQPLVALLQSHRLDDFAAPFADRGPAMDKKRDIAAEPRGQLGELRVVAFDAGQITQHEQHRGRVAAAAAKPRADRDFFFQVHADAGSGLELVEKKPRRPRGEIILRIRKSRIGTGEFDAGGSQVNLDRIAQRDRRHECFELVEAVGATAENAEIEIDFGGSELFHFHQVRSWLTISQGRAK
jgi:hypothetical protein